MFYAMLRGSRPLVPQFFPTCIDKVLSSDASTRRAISYDVDS
jgi:hypothetical protein